ncbi:hypothetical protein [Desulfovibrio sp. SGI.169]|uniref:hypothetical protein n=1 Tax=Desulfovibrio sp. SGI.169 TaxID=3420561 RepID=UPI003CFD70F5
MRYIALTALQSHWKGPKETLLLTDGCRLYDGGNKWKDYSQPIDIERFHSIKKLESSYVYCKKIVDNIFPYFADVLENKYLLKLPLRAYKQLLYPWMLQFVQALYDRYLSVCVAGKKFTDFCFLTTEREMLTICDTLDYTKRASSCDAFNLNLYSDIIRLLDLPRHDLPAPKIANPDFLNLGTLKKNIGWKEILARATLKCGLTICNKAQHLLYGVYGVPDLKALLRNHVINLFPSWHQINIKMPALDRSFRGQRLSFAGKDPFVSLLGALALRYLPVVLCEALPDILGWARAQRLPCKGALVTSTGMYNDILLTALSVVSNIPLAIVEHGGGGMNRINFHEDIQLTVADRYYGMGCHYDFWLPSPYLNLSGNRQELSPPVLVANDSYRFLPRLFPVWSEGSMQPYHNRRISFLRLLPKDKRPCIRLFSREFGWGVRKRLDAALPGLHYQDAIAVPMEQCLADSCLLVLDHYGTTFHRSMATNCPTLVFTRPDIFSARAEPVIAALRACGVWHDTPESAAKFYMNLVGTASSWDSAAINILDWWTSGDVQKARKSFCDAYAQTSEYWTRDWVTAFDILAEEAGAKSSY